MVSTFWEIPGLASEKSLEFLERSLAPMCVYDDRGCTIYASQSFLSLLQTSADSLDFFDYFASESTSQTMLAATWNHAVQGKATKFLAKTKQVLGEIECSLQFDPDAKFMFLLAKKADADGAIHDLMAKYERSLAQLGYPSLATALISPDGIIMKCNQRLHTFLGTSDQETLRIEQFVHPEDRLLDADLRQSLLAGEISSYTIEKRFIARNNEIIWINASVSLIETPIYINGSQKFFAVLLEDVTESRKMYSALVQTEEKWKAFVLNSPYLFIQTSNLGQILYVSPAVEKMLGYEEAELLGCHITELIHPYHFSEFEQIFQSWVQDQEISLGIECWWRSHSGRWVSLYMQGQRFPSALEIDGVVISGYNTTDRKWLEEELKTTQARYDSLVRNLPGAVFQCDAVYKMASISDGIEDITGYPASAFMNSQENSQDQSYLSIVHPDDIPLIQNSLVQSVLDQHCIAIEYRLIHADGSIKWVSERKQGVFDQDGRLLWLDGILLDISIQKRSEAECKQARANLGRCESANLAMLQMFPGLSQLNVLECFPHLILAKKVKMGD